MSNYPDPDEYNDDFEEYPFDYDDDGWTGNWDTDDAPVGFDDR